MIKQPPHSVESEQSVLGGLMLDPRAWDRVEGIVTADDFYRQTHRLIFTAIAELYRGNRSVDVITVSDRLSETGLLEEVGGLSYVAGLANNTPGIANIKAYAEVVRDRSRRRQALRILSLAVESVRAEGEEAITRTISDLMELFASHGSHTCELHEAAWAALEEVDRVMRTGKKPGIPSGLTELDAKLGGFHPSDLIVIGGRPGMGKTSQLLNFVWHSNVPSGVISAEQPAIQLGQRALAMVGRVNGNRFRNASLDDQDFPRSVAAHGQMKAKSIHLYDKARPTLEEVAHQARRWKRERDIQLLGVDYIQRLVSPHGDSAHERIQEVVVGLKSIAREINVPVIAISSLNRDLEKRTNRRPVMSDFMGSSAIESEADVVIGLYRDEVYNEDPMNRGLAELIFLKNRHGPVGYIQCEWQEDFMVFENITK